MFLFSCLSESVGYLLGLIGKGYPRRNLLVMYLGLSALCSLPVAIIPSSDQIESLTINTILIIVFASLGKVFGSTALYIMYHYSSTIYPTSIRTTLVSYVSSFGRVGSIIAPLINLLRFTVWEPLPYYIYSATTAFACILSIYLPNEMLINHVI